MKQIPLAPRTSCFSCCSESAVAARTSRASAITIDNTRSSVLPDAGSRVSGTAQFMLGRDEPLRLRVFLDRTAVEVFTNGKQYAALRVYPGRDESLRVSLRPQSRDCVLKSLDAWQMMPFYEGAPNWCRCYFVSFALMWRT